MCLGPLRKPTMDKSYVVLTDTHIFMRNMVMYCIFRVAGVGARVGVAGVMHYKLDKTLIYIYNLG